MLAADKRARRTYMLLGGIDKLGEQLLIRLCKAKSVDVRGCSSEDGLASKSRTVRRQTHAKAYATEVYFDQLTPDRGRLLLCHDAYHDEATWDPPAWVLRVLFEDLPSRTRERTE